MVATSATATKGVPPPQAVESAWHSAPPSRAQVVSAQERPNGNSQAMLPDPALDKGAPRSRQAPQHSGHGCLPWTRRPCRLLPASASAAASGDDDGESGLRHLFTSAVAAVLSSLWAAGCRLGRCCPQPWPLVWPWGLARAT
eukprot:SM002641S09956  [mRNA]  locus=s2641:112:828:+ [translate_table: standard]